jgi:DNA-binding CsgD family transcriptional regulator
MCEFICDDIRRDYLAPRVGDRRATSLLPVVFKTVFFRSPAREAGGSACSLPLAWRLCLDQTGAGQLSRVAPAAAGVSTLTPTEARVAALVANGRTNKEVAAELFLSVKTVEANLSRVYDKLNVRSRSELVVRLISQR